MVADEVKNQTDLHIKTRNKCVDQTNENGRHIYAPVTQLRSLTGGLCLLK